MSGVQPRKDTYDRIWQWSMSRRVLLAIIIVFSLSCSCADPLATSQSTNTFSPPRKCLTSELTGFTIEVGWAADNSQESRREHRGGEPHAELESALATVEVRQGKAILKAQEVPLDKVLEAIRREWSGWSATPGSSAAGSGWPGEVMEPTEVDHTQAS